jgi:hypothetical protein
MAFITRTLLSIVELSAIAVLIMSATLIVSVLFSIWA